MQKLALIAKNAGRRSGSQALPAAMEAVGKAGAIQLPSTLCFPFLWLQGP